MATKTSTKAKDTTIELGSDSTSSRRGVKPSSRRVAKAATAPENRTVDVCRICRRAMPMGLLSVGPFKAEIVCVNCISVLQGAVGILGRILG